VNINPFRLFLLPQNWDSLPAGICVLGIASSHPLTAELNSISSLLLVGNIEAARVLYSAADYVLDWDHCTTVFMLESS